MIKKILGLDLGTNSIGWALVEHENGLFNLAECDDKPTKGVIVFPEGVKIEEGKEKSRAAERTGYRSARRLKFRRKLRKYETLLLLSKNNMCPLPESKVTLWRKSGFKEYPGDPVFLNWLKTDEETENNPYYFRDKLSKEKCDWRNNNGIAYELGRAFYHMAQRRGFKSNRLEQSDENIISDTKEQIQDIITEAQDKTQLVQGIEEIFADYDFENRKNSELNTTELKLKKIWKYSCSTVPENRVKEKDFSNFEDAKKEIDRYINRPENLGEVKGKINELSNKIEESDCQTLGQYFWHIYQQDRNIPDHKIRDQYTAREEHYEKEFNVICDKQQLPDGLKGSLHKAIFFQRPLRSQKGLVGKCTFEKTKARCPISRPEFEEFRMWSFINSIKIKNPDDEQLRCLKPNEKDMILPKFYRQKANFKFSDITKALNPKADFAYYKEYDARDAEFLVNYKLNTTVSGCPVSAALRNVMGDNWKTKEYDYDTTNSNGANIRRAVDFKDLWHILFTYNDSDKLKEFATKKLCLDSSRVRKFSNISLQQGYGSLSLKAINKILPWLKKGLFYSHAVFMANLARVVDESVWSNSDKRKLIEDSISEIIGNHTIETSKAKAVNELINEFKKDEASYSEDLESDISRDLEEKLKNIYGGKVWERNSNRDALLRSTCALFESQVKKTGKNVFGKIKRIDDMVLEFLVDNNFVSDSKRLEYLYHPSDLESFKPAKAKDKEGNPIIINNEELEILPSPKTEAIKNPVLMRAMHQLRNLINTLLKEEIIDANTRIHIEMAREVNDSNKRAAWKKWQDKLRDAREDAIKEIKDLYMAECGNEVNPTEGDIERYLLWNEQGKKQIYESECNNISICDIVGADPMYDIEHTIPRSISWDNSTMNKTLCTKKFNRGVKKNRIPSELDNHADILQRIMLWKDKYTKLDTEMKKINASTIVDKDLKNRMIQKRHLLRFEYDYFKGKYERFVMEEVPSGFKNSQIIDTGLIARFARKYLSCLFRTQSDNSNVFVVNGQAVSEFRKVWGIQDEYSKKSRKSHIHHCIDAVTIACMTRDKYNAFAEAWQDVEGHKDKYDVKERLQIPKPWPRFTEDVMNLESEVLIVHTHKDNVPKQSKKKLRKRGKIQYKDKEKKQPRYIQGDTVRGSLHQDTFYGAIKQNGNSTVKYVVRKKLSDIKDADLKKIVDLKVREIAIAARKKEKQLKEEIEGIKKVLKTADRESEKGHSEQIKAIEDHIIKLYIIPPRSGKNIHTPIRRVRTYAHVAEPLPDFKKHLNKKINPDGKERYVYKNWYYVQNNMNYCLALYESADKEKRCAEIVKLIDAVNYFKLSKRNQKNECTLVEPEKRGMKIKGFLRPGMSVLFYKVNPDEIWKLNQNDINNRLYFIKKTSKSGQVAFQYHQESRNDNQIKEDYITQHGTNPPNSLTNGVSSIDFNNSPVPRLLLSPVNMKMILESIDFRITINGKVEPILHSDEDK
jgi:CRISPR-associated endonuclease Csn1